VVGGRDRGADGAGRYRGAAIASPRRGSFS
jgi:hypothetical protein